MAEIKMTVFRVQDFTGFWCSREGESRISDRWSNNRGTWIEIRSFCWYCS